MAGNKVQCCAVPVLVGIEPLQDQQVVAHLTQSLTDGRLRRLVHSCQQTLYSLALVQLFNALLQHLEC